MANQQQILQTLQQLMQKNRATDQQSSAIQPTPTPPQYVAPQNPSPSGFSQKGFSGLGFLGGLGDTQNAVTGITDPSILTKLNQYLMNQSGQATGNPTPLPWQQTGAQTAGQNIGSSIMKLFGF